MEGNIRGMIQLVILRRPERPIEVMLILISQSKLSKPSPVFHILPSLLWSLRLIQTLKLEKIPQRGSHGLVWLIGDV